MFCKRYTTEQERNDLINQYISNGYTAIEERNHIDGNYICFKLTTDVNAEILEEEKINDILNSINNDISWNKLKSASYQQIDDWIDNNVTNLQEAKKVFKLLVKIIVYTFRN